MSTDTEASDEYRRLVEMIRAVRASQAADQSIAAQRGAMDAYGASVQSDPGTTTEAAEFGGVPCQVVRPAGVHPEPRVLFLHGGAYIKGSFVSHRPFVERLAVASGEAVVFADYRLAPEARYPAALDDALAALAGLAARGGVRIVGDSAGGGLALAAAMRCPDMVRCVAALSPWVDLSRSANSYGGSEAIDPILDRLALQTSATLYLGDHDRRDWGASPLFGPLDQLPPTLIQVAEGELLLAEVVDFAERATKHGTDVRLSRYVDALHVPPLFDVPSGRAAFDELVRFLQSNGNPA